MRFTPGELKVMQLLWEQGELKPAEIQQLFPAEIKNSAVRSYLSILLDKGHVVRRKEGKAFFYRAKTKQKKAFSAMLNQFMDVFCDGSAKNLMLNLVEQQKLTDAEIRELQSVAKSQAKNKPRKKSQPNDSTSKRRKGKKKGGKR